MADWFAELFSESVLSEGPEGVGATNVSTTCTWPAMAAASSLSKCGLLFVFSSCSMVATTTSSFIPSVSSVG